MAESAVFVYEGKDRQGRKTKGEITSVNPNIAKAQLRKQGIVPTRVRKKTAAGGLFSFGGKIAPNDIAMFTRQMATMMKAGVPLVQSFDIVADGSDNPKLRDLIKDIRNDVSSGNSFAQAIQKHPKHFDELFCNLIHSGEQSGALETMLDRVATYKEKTEALKGKIRSALVYPISVVCIAFIVAGILLIYVVPQFETIFKGFGADLPAFTQFVVDLSEWAQTWWIAVLAVIGYSLNDTIVVSDRIRENFRKIRKGSPVEIINQSLNQTLGRTLVTSLTTLFVLLALLFAGGEGIRGFAAALTIGVVVGTYSSIFVAANVLLLLNIQREDLLVPEKETLEEGELP